MTAHRARVVVVFTAAWLLAVAVAYPLSDWWLQRTIRGWFG